MDGTRCLGNRPHVWVGAGDGWKCRACGKAGVDCPDCDGTGWAESGDDLVDDDCEKCHGTGVVPAAGAGGEAAGEAEVP